MKARMTVINPDKIEATLSITMTIKDWKELRETMSNKYPAWHLRSAITDLIDKVNVAITIENKEVST